MSESEEPAPVPMPDAAVSINSRARSVKLNNLFLDANNYRFIDESEYCVVPADKLTDSDVQRRTTGFLLGSGTEGVRDLLASIRKNGWLPIDQIQVRELSRGKYLVVEGNRRVAALKYLQRRYEEGGADLGNFSPAFFDQVPVVLYDDASEAHHLVIAGLAHIAGKKKWSALNQARALSELMVKHEWSEEDTRQALGIERKDLRRALRALALCETYAASEYGDQVGAEKYTLFREVVSSPALREWLAWDDTSYEARNAVNLERLFSWISRESSTDEEEGAAAAPVDPVLNTGTDVRELAKIIHDEGALRALDETRRLSDATFSSEVVVQDRLADGLRKINDNIGVLFNHTAKLTETHLADAEEAMRKLRGLLAARNKQPALLGGPIESTPFNAIRHGHFTEITLDAYRRFHGLKVSELRRVNLFVGSNNSGKTSLLEAVQLLVSQNDITALLELIQRRGKIHDDPPPGWLVDQIPAESCISGVFDTVPDNKASVIIRKKSDGEDLENKAFYLTSIEIVAHYGGRDQESLTHIFERRERITRFQSCRVLCPAVFSSPFVEHDTRFLAELFDRSVKEGTKKEIVDFIRDQLDPAFKDVDQTTGHQARQFARFLVQHDQMSPAPDLTQFGEGLQRIFHIGLLFAYARDGIALIDEFENAIHFKLLKPFTRLVQELAVKFNVQVFLTSHSKECIDAFVENGYKLEDVAAYALRVGNAEAECFRYPGEQLHQLVEAVDMDIRA